MLAHYRHIISIFRPASILSEVVFKQDVSFDEFFSIARTLGTYTRRFIVNNITAHFQIASAS